MHLFIVGIHFIAPKARSAFTFRILDRQFPTSAIPLLTLQLGVDFLLAVTLSRPAFSAPHNFLWRIFKQCSRLCKANWDTLLSGAVVNWIIDFDDDNVRRKLTGHPNTLPRSTTKFGCFSRTVPTFPDKGSKKSTTSFQQQCVAEENGTTRRQMTVEMDNAWAGKQQCRS